MTWFRLKNVALVGSALSRYANISALLRSADMVHNFYSSHDEAAGRGAASGAGGVGFRNSSEYVTRRPSFLTAHNLVQRELPGIRHSGDPIERQHGRIPWLSRQLAMRYYAGTFALRDARSGVESASWLKHYEHLRQTMGMGWTIPLPPDYMRPYKP